MLYLRSSFITALVLSIIYPGMAQVQELDWNIETVSEGHGFTEGASLASDGKIYFSDMDNQKILFFNPATGATEVWQKRSGKSNGLFVHGHHLYACEAAGRSVVRYDLEQGPGSRKVLTSTYQGDSLGCPNDLTVVGKKIYFSEFWIPGFHRNTGASREIFQNRVYALPLKKDRPDSLGFDFDTPNGVASSPGGDLLFVGDVAGDKLYQAEITNNRTGPFTILTDLASLGLHGPDGMTIDRDGRIFLALFRTDKLLVLHPDGTPVGTLATGPLTSNCIFASDGKTLYITADKKLKRVVVPPITH